jgi:hypothetical protein
VIHADNGILRELDDRRRSLLGQLTFDGTTAEHLA